MKLFLSKVKRCVFQINANASNKRGLESPCPFADQQPSPSLFPSGPLPSRHCVSGDRSRSCEGSYTTRCTSGGSKPAPGAALLSVGCPASSPATKATGRGRFSSALLFPAALLSCQVRTARRLIPTLLQARSTLEII